MPSDGPKKPTPDVTDEQANAAMEIVRAYRRNAPGVTHDQARVAGRLLSRYVKQGDRRLSDEKKRRV
jgi:hypothetical protein